MKTASAKEFSQRLVDLSKVLKTARKNKVSLSSHAYYSQKARSALAVLRKAFLHIQRDYPKERFPKVAFQLATMEPMMQKLVSIYPAKPSEMLRLIGEIQFKADSELAAELEAPEANPTLSTDTPFLPEDLLEDRQFVLKKVLWEVNRGYDAACYNSCATMIRRLVENLIIDAFDHHGLTSIIQKNGEYLEFGALLGKAAAEPRLRLTRNTKKILPDLKFLGDLGAHNRMALVRKSDIDRLHNALRAALEELARNL